jgi:hypothetical protein
MGIVAGKFITGSVVVAERTEQPQPTTNRNVISMKSLADLRSSEKVTVKKDEQGNETIVPVDKRLSSYFVVNKESDYLDHNIRNNRR